MINQEAGSGGASTARAGCLCGLKQPSQGGTEAVQSWEPSGAGAIPTWNSPPSPGIGEHAAGLSVVRRRDFVLIQFYLFIYFFFFCSVVFCVSPGWAVRASQI